MRGQDGLPSSVPFSIRTFLRTPPPQCGRAVAVDGEGRGACWITATPAFDQEWSFINRPDKTQQTRTEVDYHGRRQLSLQVSANAQNSGNHENNCSGLWLLSNHFSVWRIFFPGGRCVTLECEVEKVILSSAVQEQMCGGRVSDCLDRSGDRLRGRWRV
jgi:hypothetical protein